MKTRILPGLGLLLLLLAACAPTAASTEAPAVQPVAAEPTSTAFQPSDPSAPATDVASAPTEASAPLPVATSRGDNLEATDPRGFTLASGDLQFVEFFRFT